MDHHKIHKMEGSGALAWDQFLRFARIVKNKITRNVNIPEDF